MPKGSGASAMTTTATGNIQANPSMLCAGFNQDATCISVGSRKGYSIVNCDPFQRVYSSAWARPSMYTLSSWIADRLSGSTADGATSILEMLFCTSLIALVGAGDKPSASTRKLQIVNTKVHLHYPFLPLPHPISDIQWTHSANRRYAN